MVELYWYCIYCTSHGIHINMKKMQLYIFWDNNITPEDYENSRQSSMLNYDILKTGLRVMSSRKWKRIIAKLVRGGGRCYSIAPPPIHTSMLSIQQFYFDKVWNAKFSIEKICLQFDYIIRSWFIDGKFCSNLLNELSK